MEAWVIKRNDGKYSICGSFFSDKLIYAMSLPTKEACLEFIKDRQYIFKNCKPAKVRIEEVEE